ncbi:MAG: protein-glutamate O-methyltransferase CheR [Firmicutes bacterium]|nr:protein-glutamate O-methyltransferase CheR [Bacillota bacterium]
MINQSREATDREIEEICRVLNQRLGFNYTLQKKYLVQSRLNKRLNDLNLNSYQAYMDLVKQDLGEFNKLVSLVTTNVTSFFREADQFQILRQELLPNILANIKKDNKIRCWSAGCSSGEEAYTLAIVINETLEKGWDLRVLASDISTVKLKEGMAGIYPQERMVRIPQELQGKYFTPLIRNPGYYQVKPGLRDQICFRKLNLVEAMDVPDRIRFDLILCRNVFIYLTPRYQEKAINSFYYYLKDKGYLFLGHSESLNYEDQRWIPLKKSIYRKM